MNNKKTIFQRLFFGVKKGFITPTIPESIIALQKKNPLIRLMFNFKIKKGFLSQGTLKRFESSTLLILLYILTRKLFKLNL